MRRPGGDQCAGQTEVAVLYYGEGNTVTLANRITIFRLFMIPVFVVCVMSYRPEAVWLRHLAIFVFVVAALSDALDGFVARAYDQKTKLGAVLDPLADKLLVNTSFVFLAVNPHFETRVPAWLPVIVLSRDVFITGGAYLINMFYGPVRVRPRITGKITMLLQNASIAGVLLEVDFAYELLMVMLVFSVISWADYFYKGLEQVGDEDRE